MERSEATLVPVAAAKGTLRPPGREGEVGVSGKKFIFWSAVLPPTSYQCVELVPRQIVAGGIVA